MAAGADGKRGGLAARALQVLAALAALGTIKAAATMLGARAEFLSAFPGLSAAAFAPLLALVAINFAAAVGTLFLWRVAVAVLVAAGALTVVVDVLARGPALHLATALAMMALVLPAAWLARPRLR